jgi:hypothetical protein
LLGRGGAGLGAGWNGKGITSSAAAAANAAEPEAWSLGYAENSALPFGPYTSFRGLAVDDTSVLIAYTRTGDANLDGLVNDNDVTILGATYSPGAPQPHWALGDFDYNGFVDDDDATLLGVLYQPTAGATAPPLNYELRSTNYEIRRTKDEGPGTNAQTAAGAPSVRGGESRAQWLSESKADTFVQGDVQAEEMGAQRGLWRLAIVPELARREDESLIDLLARAIASTR